MLCDLTESFEDQILPRLYMLQSYGYLVTVAERVLFDIDGG